MAERKTFGDLIKRVKSRVLASTAEIQRELNSGLMRLGISLRKIEEKIIDVTAVSSFDIPVDIVAVKEVYLNSKKLTAMTKKEYEEGDYTTNSYYFISKDERKIYFPGNLVETDELKLWCAVDYDESTDLLASTILDIPKIYYELMVVYILKQLFLYKDYNDKTMYLVFRDEYNELKGILKGLQFDETATSKINVGGYKLD